MFLTLFRNFCDMQEISKILRMPLSSCESLFTHSNWKEEYELETSSCIVCLFCPKFAFCDVIIDSSHLVETVKRALFETSRQVFVFYRSEKYKFFEHWYAKMNNSVLKGNVSYNDALNETMWAVPNKNGTNFSLHVY